MNILHIHTVYRGGRLILRPHGKRGTVWSNSTTTAVAAENVAHVVKNDEWHHLSAEKEAKGK